MTITDLLTIAVMVAALLGAAWALVKVIAAGWRWRQARHDHVWVDELRKAQHKGADGRLLAKPGDKNYPALERLVTAGKKRPTTSRREEPMTTTADYDWYHRIGVNPWTISACATHGAELTTLGFEASGGRRTLNLRAIGEPQRCTVCDGTTSLDDVRACQCNVSDTPCSVHDHQADDKRDTPNLRAHHNMANPFVAYADILRSDYGAAVRIRALVLHLFNADDYPVDMGYLLRATDTRHRAAVFAMLHWYAAHGENCAVFMDAARRLAGDE